MSIRDEVAVMAEEYGISERTIMSYTQGVLKRIKEEHSNSCYDKEDILECLERVVSTCSSLREETNIHGKKMTVQMIINDAVDSKFDRNYDYDSRMQNTMSEEEIQFLNDKLEEFISEKRIIFN